MATNEVDTHLSFSQRYDRAVDNPRALKGIAYVLASNTDQEDAEIAVASHLGRLAGDAIDELEQMWGRHRAEYDNKPDPEGEPREWTGATAEAEVRALTVRQLMDFCSTVVTADQGDNKPSAVTLEEISSRLKRGASAKDVSSFRHLKHNGLATLTEAPAETAPDKMHEETIAEIRDEYADADEAEVKLRVAIRESISMTRAEENSAYERIAKALSWARGRGGRSISRRSTGATGTQTGTSTRGSTKNG